MTPGRQPAISIKAIEPSIVSSRHSGRHDLDACPPDVALAGLAVRSGRSQVAIRFSPLSVASATTLFFAGWPA
jgi:hypothetical protein